MGSWIHVWANVSTVISHIPVLLRPPIRGLAIVTVVIVVNLWWAWQVRSQLADAFGSKEFVQIAHRRGVAAAMWNHLRRDAVQHSRRAYASWLLSLVGVYLLATIMAAGFVLQAATLRHSRSGFTTLPVTPTMARLILAGYVIGPLLMFYSGAKAVLHNRSELTTSPIGFRGSRWAKSQKRAHDRLSALSVPAPVTFRATVQWPVPLLDPEAARRAAIRAYRPWMGSVAAAAFLATASSVGWFYPQGWGTDNDIPLAVLAVSALAGIWLLRSFIPLDIRAQSGLLWCLQHDPVARAGALQDPLGPLRAGLARSRRLLLAQARRLERHQRAVGRLPVPLALRGVARDIQSFLEGEDCLSGVLSDQLRQTLELTVQFMAGSGDAKAVSALSTKVRAFDPDSAQQLLPRRSLIIRAPAALSAIVQFLRNAVVAVLIVGGIALILTGQVALSGLAQLVK